MKALGGGGGSWSKTSNKAEPKPVVKAKPPAKKLSHSELAAQWEANGRDESGKLIKGVETKRAWTQGDIDRARRAKERAEEQAAADKKQAAEGKRLAACQADAEKNAPVVPVGEFSHELAQARMAELARQIQSLTTEDAEGRTAEEPLGPRQPVAEYPTLAECRRSQLQELELLEAMFPDEFLLSNPMHVQALRAAVEQLDAAADDDEALRAIAESAPLECVLQMTVRDEPSEAAAAPSDSAAPSDGAGKLQQLVASILLRVRFPPLYPTPGTPPIVRVEDVMITDALAPPLGKDKLLSTCAILDQAEVVAAMLRLAAEAQPDPVVHEMVSWLLDNAFAFVTRLWA